MGFGIDIGVGDLLNNLPGVGRLFGGPDDPYGDWLEQQRYNSPVEQMKRLEEAGLNPNLIYANGISNTATTAIRSRDGGLKLGVGYNADSSNTEVQKKLLEAQLGLLDDRAKGLELDNVSKKLKNDLLEMTIDYYRNSGGSPAMHPMEKLGHSIYSRVMDYDQKTGNLSKAAYQFFTFMNNLFGYGSSENLPVVEKTDFR